jgi:hypothetical protein
MNWRQPRSQQKVKDKSKAQKEIMKKTISILSILLLTIFLTTADLAAQTRINFRRGSTSATVRGTIGVNRGVAGANYRSYVLRAKAGQTISATVSSRNGKVVFTENDETDYTIETNSSGNYILRIYNGGGNNTSYAITFSIR